MTTKTWLMLLTIQFISMASMEMSNPFWALHLTALGLASNDNSFAFYLGFIYVSPSLIAIFSIPYWGKMGDRYGHKPMLMRSLAALFICQLMIAYSESIYVLLLARILQGVFAGFLASEQAYALSLAQNPEKPIPVAKIIAALQTTSALSSFVGPLVGGVLMDHIGFNKINLSAAILCLLCCIMTQYLPRSTNHLKPSKSTKVLVKSNKIPATLLLCLLLICFLQIAKSLSIPIFAIFVQEVLKAPAKITGISYGASALGLALSAPLWARLCQNHLSKSLIAIAFASAVSALLFIFMSYSPSPHLVILYRLGWGICLGALLPLSYALIIYLNQDTQHYGWYMALSNSASKLGNTLGLALGAVLLGHESSQNLLNYISLSYVICILITLIIGYFLILKAKKSLLLVAQKGGE